MTSHANSLSPSPINAGSSRSAFTQAERGDEGPQRASTMVEKDRPSLAPHPTPDIAGGSNRAAFNDRWAQEQRAADQAREERKSAFFKMRTDPETGGHVRVFSRNNPLNR